MSKEYLYHCKGCQKADEEYPNKKKECEECEGSGREDKGTGKFRPRIPVSYHMWARNDAYGIYTGLYCDDCYKNNYPYRTDRYHDEAYCGERLEPDE